MGSNDYFNFLQILPNTTIKLKKDIKVYILKDKKTEMAIEILMLEK